MKIDENATIKELQALKRKIEKKISSKQSGKEDMSKFYEMIKNDHARHVRTDGRKIFRGVVDYLECYVNGLPPIAKASFYQRFGIKSKRARITPEKVSEINSLISGCKRYVLFKNTPSSSGIVSLPCKIYSRTDLPDSPGCSPCVG